MTPICCPALPTPFRLQPRRSNRVHGVRCCSGSPNHKEKDNSTPQLLKIALLRRDKLNLFLTPCVDLGHLALLVNYSRRRAWPESVLTLYVPLWNEVNPVGWQGKKLCRELYSRNLKLLVPFFDQPSITLQKIDKGAEADTNIVLAFWKLRTYLKLPWRPLISVDGSTTYELDDEFKVIRHAESWNVSALEAVGQIFTPSDGKHGE
ncbi:hypothetical protein RJ639_005138 [Escallonia herrerae]|uniref:Uncharacterized protein n=1 Tax=Escallonia herrerae TaxID=1293975 RepID=A0AA89AWD9_9ASTE|nr:hypothetical protein RJ639_005138 [Escallonia herrerae]